MIFWLYRKEEKEKEEEEEEEEEPIPMDDSPAEGASCTTYDEDVSMTSSAQPFWLFLRRRGWMVDWCCPARVERASNSLRVDCCRCL